MKKVVILGSTGSVGKQTLEVIRRNPNDFKVLAVSGNTQKDLLAAQAKEFGAQVGEPCELATFKEADLVVNAISGCAGIEPTYRAVEAGKDVALANKESLVSAGDIIVKKAKETGAQIIPIDSEHSAIFQILRGRNIEEIEKIILTCSGGPFHGRKDLKGITKEQALKHPTWQMGPKITIDCATLMNKGLEVIEAKHLFGVPANKIEVVIHKESVVHSMVQFCDGTTIALLAERDMKIPIASALYYPEHKKFPGKPLDLTHLNLTFQEPDLETFKLLALAIEVAEEEGTRAACMNLANDKAVGAFLAGKIQFHEIPEMVVSKTRNHKSIANPKIEDVLALRI